MSKLDAIKAAPPAVRAATLTLLDEISAPLHPGQLDRAFQDQGFTRREARAFTLALKHLDLIAVVPKP